MRSANTPLIVAATATALLLTCFPAPPAHSTPSVRTEAATPDALQRQTMSHIRSVAISVQAYRVDHEVLPGEVHKSQPVEELRSLLEPTYIRELPVADAWGNPLLYATDGESFTVLSTGSDGTADMGRGAGDARDILWRDDAFLLSPGQAPPRPPRLDRARLTLQNMRSIATAMEAYAVDHQAYPMPVAGFTSTAQLREVLEPTYILNLPVRDGWGEPIRFWSSGQDYRLVSGGADRTIMTTESSPLQGDTEDEALDIVYQNGTFLQAPGRLRHR